MHLNIKDKMKTKFLILLLSIVFFTISSCDLSDDGKQSCTKTEGTPTASVTGPTEAATNETITLEIGFNVYNSCGDFYLFYEQNILDIKYITVNAKYDGCTCTTGVITKTANYSFTAATAGTYVLRFKTSNTSYIEHTIVVTD